MADADSVARLRAAVGRAERLLGDMPSLPAIGLWADSPVAPLRRYSSDERPQPVPDVPEADEAPAIPLSAAEQVRSDARTVATSLLADDRQRATAMIADAALVAEDLRAEELANANAKLVEAERVALELMAERLAAAEDLIEEARLVAARLTQLNVPPLGG